MWGGGRGSGAGLGFVPQSHWKRSCNHTHYTNILGFREGHSTCASMVLQVLSPDAQTVTLTVLELNILAARKPCLSTGSPV